MIRAWRALGAVALLALLVGGVWFLADDLPFWVRAVFGVLWMAQLIEGCVVLWKNRPSVLGE